MSSFKKLVCLTLSLVILAGCEQKKNPKQSIRTGRGLRGSTMVNTGAVAANAAACGSYQMQGKYWGEVTSYQGDQAFYQAVLALTAPVLSQLPADDQLGYVSGQSGQNTGVRFWGTVVANSMGQIDPTNSEIRLEIFDDRACMTKADGTIRPVVPIHIGANQPGFAGADGFVSGGNVRINFVDNYGSITLEGQISGAYFSGIISYSTAATGGQSSILGRFQIPAQGFFYQIP